MITELLAGVGVNIVVWLASIFPEVDVPEWLYSSRPAMLQALQTYDGLGVWVPWDVLGGCIALVASVYGITLVIRLIRAVVAHVPQFGGGGA